MRKRYLSFLLSLIIFLTSFTPAFADSVEVLEPIMSGVESSEEKDNHSSDRVFVLDSRDKNNKVVENKSNSTISMPNILEERNNKVENKKVENIKDIVNPVKPQIEELTEREKATAVKNTVDEKEAVNEGLEVSEPMGGVPVTGSNATKPADGWGTYEIGNGWTLGDFTYHRDSVTGLSDSGFKKVKTNKDLIIPSVIPDNNIQEFTKLKPVTTIGEMAFRENQLTSVVFPDSLTNIEDWTFNNNQLTSVVFPKSLASIGDNAFEYNKLTSVVFPESLTSIGTWAFSSNQLTSVVFHEGLTNIGKAAFQQNQLTSVVLPDSLTNIEDSMFYYNQLTSVVLPKNLKSVEEFAFSNNQITSVVFPESLTSIGEAAFQANQLTSVVLPKNLTSVKFASFSGNKLTSVVFPDNLKDIEHGAFAQNNLTSLNIPDSLNEIGREAFGGNPGSNDKHQVFLYTKSGNNPNNLPDSNYHLIDPRTPTDDTLFTFEGDILTGLSEKGLGLLKGNSKSIFTVPYKTPSGGDVREIKESAFEGLEANFVFPIDPNKIEKIGDHAFFKNKITELNFSNFRNLIEVGPYAFAHNEVKSLVMPESLKTVGNYAFRDNLIQEVDTKNIETIREGAFSNNRIEKLTFGDALTTIGSHAFEQNDLVKVDISNNVTSFGKSVFAFNNRYVKVETENPIIKTEKTYRGFGHVVNPVIIKVKCIDKDTKEEILDSKTMGEDLTVEGGIFILGEENIFYPEKIKGYWMQDEVKFTPDKDNYELVLEYKNLKAKPTIEITDLRMIKKDEKVDKETLLSFVKATDLMEKDISDKISVSPETIDTSTGGPKKATYTVKDEFGNTEVKEVEIPVAIDWFKYPIGNGWVLGDFTYDGNTVTGFSAQGKEKVKTNKDLVVPSVIPETGAETFDKLKPVTKIKSGGWNNGAFSRNQLTSVIIPDSLTSIGSSSFLSNQLTSIVLPENLTSIGAYAFGANQLTSIVLPENLTSIENSAFRKNQLTSVVIPDSVTTIGRHAFADNQLTSIVIGNSVTTMGNYAFKGNQLTSVTIPGGLTDIGNGAFSYNQLTSVVFPEGLTSIGESVFRNNQLTSVAIPKGITTIENGAFYNNKLTSIIIPDSVTKIGKSAFENNKLTSVVVPSGSIGVKAFYDNLLTDVVLGNGIEAIGEYAFSGYINDYDYQGKNPGNQIKSLKLGKSIDEIEPYTFYNNQLTSVVIPEGVTTIGDYAFQSNQLTSVVIPDSVDSIGTNAFRNNKLTSVVVPNANIGNKAFYDNFLTDVVIGDEVETIGEGAFAGYMHTPDGGGKNPGNEIKNLKLGKKVTSIRDSAFHENKLTNIVIPNRVTAIEMHAFSFNQLTSVIIPEGVTTIGDSAFDSNQLTSVVIPKGVTTIGEGAFDSNQLTSVVIPEGVTSIEESAFELNKLKKVYIPLSLKEIGKEAFAGNIGEDDNHNVSLYTPDRTNPNNLQNESTTKEQYVFPNEDATEGQWVDNYTSGHIINPLSLKINFVSEDGKILQDSTENRVSEGQKIDLPKFFGYKIKSIKETGEALTSYSHKVVSSGQSLVVWTLVYQKEQPEIKDGVTLKTWLNPSTNKDPHSYYIGEEQRLNVKFNITKNIPNINNMEARVQIPDVVDKASVRVPVHPNIKEFKIEGNILSIKLQNITRNTSIEIPVLFKMNKYTTPENTEFELRTTLVDNNGEYLYSILENKFSGFYRKPRLDIYAGNTSQPWVDGPRVLGNMKYVNGDTTKKRIDGPFDFDFRWAVNIAGNSILDRNIESYTIETELPKYIAYDANGNEVTKTATFKQELNEGWVLSGDKLTYTEKDLNTNSPSYKKITLSFPEAKDGTQIDLNAKITFTPKNKAERENSFIVNDKITIYAIGETVATGSFLYSSPKVRWSWQKGDHLYDIPVDREKTIPWSFGLSKNYNNAEFKNLNAEITELDNRFEYKSITNTGNDELIFKIYKNGKQVDEITLQGKEESKELPQGVDKIEISSVKDSIIDTASFNLNIKNKEPNKNIAVGQVKLHLSGSIDTKKENGEEIKQTTSGYDSFNIYALEYELKADIDSSKKGKSVATGETVNYSVRLQDYANKEKHDSEFFDEDLVNFKQVVVLPQNAQIKEITVSEGFKNSPKSRYKIVNLGQGYQAVVFEAEKLNQKTNDIANIEILATTGMRDSKHITETYATWDNKDIVKGNEVNIPERIAQILSGKASEDSLEYSLASVKAVFSEKYVKDANGLYGISSITNDGNIDYQLKVVNSEDGNRTNVTILDILPFKGDDRESQLDVFLREPVTATNGKVLYTTDKNPTENSNFTETYSEGVTAVKIIVNSINANSTFVADLKCKINLPTGLDKLAEMSNKTIFNDFLRKDDLTDTFVKTNPVETKYMLGNASIEFSKFGLKKSIFFNNYKKKPLAGAEFELKDLDGNYIASAISDSNGKVVFTNVEAKDYIIREVKAPKGYEVGKDIRVLTSDYQLVNGKIKAILEDEVINNAPRYGNLTINKVTINDNPLPEIEFTIRGTGEGNKNFIKTITTGSDGKAMLRKIPEGNYIVEETGSGRFIPAPPQTFKIEQSQDELILGNQEINLKFVNNKVKVRLNKLEYDANEEVPHNITQISKFNRKTVEGVVFEINGKQYTTNKDGYIEFVVDLSNRNVVNRLNLAQSLNDFSNNFHTDDLDEPEPPNEGPVLIENPLDVQIKELSAPVEYVKFKKFDFVLSNGYKPPISHSLEGMQFNIGIDDYGNIFFNLYAHNEFDKFIYDEINVPNQLKKVKAKIEINKSDNMNNPLRNAEFTVTKLGKNKETLGLFTSNEQGKLNITLNPGTYEIEETKAPDGYFKNGFKKIITIPENPHEIKNIETDEIKAKQEFSKETYDFYKSYDEEIIRHIKYKVANKPLNVNALKYETILQNVEKEDVTNYEGKEGYKVIQGGNRYSVVKPLQGVKFDLYEGDTKVGSYQTGADGYINFNNYKFKENGIYNLVETETLEGFKLEKAPTRINIKSLSKVEEFDGNININIENKRITGKIVISKYDEKTRTILPNQEFTLYDNTGKEISKKVTNSAGLIEFNNLTPGTYTFKETKVNGDYLLDDKVYTANITLNNLLHVEKIFNKTGSIDVKVTKVDDQGSPLEGVEFAIFKNGKMIYGPIKTNKDGIAIFKNVKIEDGLIVKETATIKDYQLNQEEITLDLQNTENQVEVKYTNHKAEQVLPDTGTLNELPFIGTATLLLAISIFLRKRKVVIK